DSRWVDMSLDTRGPRAGKRSRRKLQRSLAVPPLTVVSEGEDVRRQDEPVGRRKEGDVDRALVHRLRPAVDGAQHVKTAIEVGEGSAIPKRGVRVENDLGFADSKDLLRTDAKASVYTRGKVRADFRSPSSRAYRGRFRSAGDRRRRSRAEGEVARRRLACSHREPEAEAGAQSNGRLEALRFGSDQEGIQRKLQTNSDRSPGKPFRRGHGSDDESRSASLLDQGR